MYSLSNGQIWRRIDGHAEGTPVLDDHIGVLVDMRGGGILKHGALRFVRQTHAAILARDPGRVTGLKETLAVYAFPTGAISETWLDRFNELLAQDSRDLSEIAMLFDSDLDAA